MVAGTSKKGVPSLFWIDHLSSMVELPFAAHGYASYFCMSTMGSCIVYFRSLLEARYDPRGSKGEYSYFLASHNSFTSLKQDLTYRPCCKSVWMNLRFDFLPIYLNSQSK
jgi:hypothetical protein